MFLMFNIRINNSNNEKSKQNHKKEMQTFNLSIKLIFLLLLNLANKIETEGILWDPPSRMSAWRVNSSSFPIYYSDKVICCGGFAAQWNLNGKFQS